MAVHLCRVILKLCAKLRVFNAVDRAVKALVRIDGHTAPVSSQMGMVINPEIQIRYTIAFGYRSKYAAHGQPSLFSFCALRRIAKDPAFVSLRAFSILP